MSQLPVHVPRIMDRTWSTMKATLILLFLGFGPSMGYGLKLDPPENLVVSDPGHLGFLQIHWSPPASWLNITNCDVQFKLEYFNTYKKRWTAIWTSWRNFTAQFDLGKEIKIRVHTLLSGPCANGSEISSETYTELVQPPVSTGLVGSMAKNFVCLLHNIEYVECNWERSPDHPAESQQTLYYWHSELKQAKECPEYLVNNGVRSGCNFSGIFLPLFEDVNFCVNGSSPAGPLRPAFFSLQIQNHVKLTATDKLHLQMGPNKQLHLHWDAPARRVSSQCLEWEVENAIERLDGKQLLQKTLTRKMTLHQLFVPDTKKSCFRVRSRLHKYCTDDGFWSDWGRWECHPAPV